MNKPVLRSLQYDDLFAAAASAWPANLALERRAAANGGYLVEGLDLDLDDAFVNAPDAVLMTAMVDAVYETLHAWAADHDHAEPSSMGAQTRPRFERRLRRILANPAPTGWPAADVALVRRYFDVNAQPA